MTSPGTVVDLKGIVSGRTIYIFGVMKGRAGICPPVLFTEAKLPFQVSP